MNNTEMRAYMKGLAMAGNYSSKLIKAAKINMTKYQLFRLERVDLTAGELTALQAVLVAAGLYDE